MTVETLAPILLVVGAVVGCIELVLASFWVRAYWSGPAFSSRVVTREVLSPSAIRSLLDRPSAEAVFIRLEFRELPAGLLAFRERLWDRHPHLGYYGVVRGALRPAGPAIELLVFPNWSAGILVAGVLAGLISGGPLRLLGATVFAVLAFGAIVQVVRFRRLLAVAAGGGRHAATAGGAG